MTAPDSTLPTDFADIGFGLNAQRRVLLVADMVESVRLMQRHEWETTQRWRSLVQTLVQDVLPAHHGTLVQRRGDGLMLEFESVTGAAAAAFECHRRADAANHGRPGDQHIVLRMGLHQAEVLADGIDLYGAGVQLTHRLAALAQPGETLCTAEVRDELTDGLHASVCDKGERLLPGQEDPVRVYQLQPMGDAPRNLLRWAPESLLPRVAFVAAQSYANPDWNTVCQLVVTELTAAASRVTSWRVISALSTRRLTAQGLQQLDAQGDQHLADYVVQVAWAHSDSTPVISLRCTDVRRQQDVWQQDVTAPPHAWVASQEGLAADMARDLATTLLAREVRIAHDSALHSLPGYALLLAGIGLSHRSTLRDSETANAVFRRLLQLHPRSVEVRYWFSKLKFLNFMHGFGHDHENLLEALNSSMDALDLDSEHAPAAALAAYLRELSGAESQAPAHIPTTPLLGQGGNEPTAWALASRHYSNGGHLSAGLKAAKTAAQLSPVDPMMYFYLTFCVRAAIHSNDINTAANLSNQCIRLNKNHLPSLMYQIAICVWNDNATDARLYAQHYLSLRPQASISKFLSRQSKPLSNVAQRIATALSTAGIPT